MDFVVVSIVNKKMLMNCYCVWKRESIAIGLLVINKTYN